MNEDVNLVGAVALLGFAAIDHRVAEPADVSRRFPDLGIHDDRAIETDHVVSHHHVIAPPCVLDVSLEFHSKRAVVPEAVEAAVNLT